MRAFFEPVLTGKESGLVDDVIRSGYINDGPMVRRFEEAIARRVGVRHAICVSSGTAALYCALRAQGIGPGEEVTVPDVTFIATANAVRMTGAHVRLGQVDERLLLREGLAGPSVPVHVSGRIAHAGIVEDACEAFPSKPRRISAVSFSPNKLITTGQGGAVLTDDDRLAKAVREMKDQGRTWGTGTGGEDIHHSVGFNFKMTDLQAAVGLAQMDVLDERIDRQMRTHALYVAALPVIPFHEGEIPLWTDMVHPDREAIIARVEAAGYVCRRFWKPISQQAPYLDRTMTTDTSKLFWLPSSFAMTDDDVCRVIEAVQG